MIARTMLRRVARVAMLAGCTLSVALPRVGSAQNGFSSLAANTTTAPLSATVSVTFENVALREIVAEIARQAALSLTYDPALPGLDARTSLRVVRVSAATALVRALERSPIEAMVSPTGQVVLVTRATRAKSDELLGGVVRDSAAMPVVGARVELVGTRFATISRDDGRFTLGRVPMGRYTLRATRLGFRPVVLDHVTIADDADIPALEIAMERTSIPLSAIVVTPGYFGMIQPSIAGHQAMSRQQIETVPQIGEDIYRAVNRLPGVASSDFSSNFTVRGGAGEELYATLDGLELVEPFHLKDFGGGLSILDAASIGSVELTTGGFSAEYGDRLTGVFTMRSVEPRSDRTRTSVGLSLMNARIQATGGFAGGRGGWLASLRRGYLDIALRLAESGDSLKPRYYDAFGKVEYDLRGGGRIAAHVLYAGDNLTYRDIPDPNINSKYNSGYAWLTWDDRFGARFRQQTVLSFGTHGWNRLGDGHTNAGILWTVIDDHRTYSSANLRQDWSFDISRRALLKWGVEAKRESSSYDYFRWVRDSIRGDGTPGHEVLTVYDTVSVDYKPSGNRIGAYVSQRLRPADALTMELGLRFDRASYAGDNLLAPRFNASWEVVKGTTLRGAWGRYSQAQAPFAVQVPDGVGTIADAERAEQRVLGVEQLLPGGLLARVEGYQRRTSQVTPRYVSVLGGLDVFPEINWDRVLITPTRADARGLETMLSRDGATNDWSVSYAVARAVDRVGDRWIPRMMDQRHTVHADLAIHPASNSWRLAIAQVWHSGWPYTPQNIVIDTIADTPNLIRFLWRWVPLDVGTGRLPSYQRTDFRLTRYFDTSAGRISVFGEVFNLFNTTNLRAYVEEFSIRGRPTQWTLTRFRNTETMVGRLPTVGFTWEFGAAGR